MKRKKEVYEPNSSFTKLAQFRHYYHGPEKITNIDPSEKENYKLRRKTSQSLHYEEEDSWVKLRNKISTDCEMNPNTNVRSVFSLSLDEPRKEPEVVPESENQDQIWGSEVESELESEPEPKMVVKSSTGIQTDKIDQCTHCRSYIKDVKENEMSGNESDIETDDESVCQDCRGFSLKSSLDQECRGSEEVCGGECDGSKLDQIDKAERDEKCNVNRCRDQCGEGDGVDVHDLVKDIHSDGDDSRESGIQDKQHTILEDDKNVTLVAYRLSVKDLTIFCVKVIVVIFLCASIMMWVLPDSVSTKYLSPILHYLLPNLSKSRNTEETSSFLRKCFDCLFSVTFTRF